jgi:uroporphyrinogen decarboxylase
MNARELVYSTLQGKPVPRPVCGPLAVHFCARHAGVSMREYTLNANCLAESVIAYYEYFKPDAVWVSADTWVTAEAMGAGVRFADADSPLGGDGVPVVRCRADLERIPPPDPMTQGRQPLMLDALAQVKRALGDNVFIVACFDQAPFSLACAVAGVQEVMLAGITDPEFLEALLRTCADYSMVYGKAMAAHGADMLSMGDSPVIMLGVKRYEQLALPHEQQVIEALHETTDTPVSLHICGDTTALLPAMVKSGANVLEVDHDLDMELACEVVPDEIALWGNIDPVAVLCQGNPKEVKVACRKSQAAVQAAARSRFVLSSGCTLAPETPEENVRTLIDAVANGVP